MAIAYVQTPCTADDRRYTRVPYTKDLAFITAAGRGGLAQCVNISRAGFALKLGMTLRPGTNLSLMFEDEEVIEPFEIQAEIVWCKPDGDSASFLAGARIRAMSVCTRDRLVDLLQEHGNTFEPVPA